MGFMWQGVGSGGLQGGPCMAWPGLPWARHVWFQPAQANPPQGWAERRSRDGSAGGESLFRKGQNTAR